MNHMPDRFRDELEFLERLRASTGADLRVAAPGIIQSVDTGRQTCEVQLAIRERLNFDGKSEWAEIPVLSDVPFFVYSGGGYCVTLPIKAGDDCLVVFGDSCIDAWWQSGGIQNQVEHRRHDLSDGFAIVGFRSQPAVVSNYSSGSVQVRNAAGDAYVEISGSNINIKTSGNLTINAGGAIQISGASVNIGGSTTIDGKNFLGHTHGGVEKGGANTGGVS